MTTQAALNEQRATVRAGLDDLRAAERKLWPLSPKGRNIEVLIEWTKGASYNKAGAPVGLRADHVRNVVAQALRYLASGVGRKTLTAKSNVRELDISIRAKNGLLNALDWDRETLADAAKISKYELLLTPNIGKKSADEIEAALAEVGLSLAPNPYKVGA
jgi:hypothetical protein